MCLHPQTDTWSFVYGLPKADAAEVCKAMYRENIAKVTVEIMAPDVLQIKKDIKTTFTQQLGVIGKC